MSDYKSKYSRQRERDSTSTKRPATATSTKTTATSNDNSDHLLSYYESSIPNEGHVRKFSSRPATTDTESYAQTRSAYHRHHTRKASATSPISESDSEYSYDSDTDPRGGTLSEAPTSVLTSRRSSFVPTKGGADRRRVAIVQMDGSKHKSSLDTTISSSPSSSIRSRRGLQTNLTGLALVAPPDAALRTYTHLTPPSTAPISADQGSQTARGTSHFRSASENPHHTSRDNNNNNNTAGVGFAASRQGSGTQLSLLSSSTTKGTTTTEYKDDRNLNDLSPSTGINSQLSTPDPSRSKIDQQHTRGVQGTVGIGGNANSFNSGTGPPSGLLSPPDTAYIDMFSPVITPEIGESKEIHIRVAAPVVMNLESTLNAGSNSNAQWRSQQQDSDCHYPRSESPGGASSFSASPSVLSLSYRTDASAYLRYEPGTHATAGPLPPPPRAMFNIDIHTPPPPRPPRLHSPAPPRASTTGTGRSGSGTGTGLVRQRTSDIEAVRQALQLPHSVTAALEKKNSTSASSSRSKVSDIEATHGDGDHRRDDQTSSSQKQDQRSSQSQSDVGQSGKDSAASSQFQLSHSSSIHRREGATTTISVPPSEESACSTAEDKLESEHLDLTTNEKLKPSSPSNSSSSSSPPPPPPHDSALLSSSASSSSLYSPPPELKDIQKESDNDKEKPRRADTQDSFTPSIAVIEDKEPDDTVRSRSPEKIDVDKFDQWLKENPHLTQGQSFNSSTNSNGNEQHSLTSPERERPMSPLSLDHAGTRGDAPSPPPKGFRNSLTQNLKRFSTLPRTPSLSSRSASSRPSSGTPSTRYSNSHSSRTPSPALHRHSHGNHTRSHNSHENSNSSQGQHAQKREKAPFKKIISTDPAALFCHEVYSQTTTLQRCAIYAAKINELYIHDCGLGEWIVDTKSRGSNNSHRGPSSKTFVPQPRQTSRSSMISEATFAIRPDATTATDLSQGAYENITPSSVAATLPYPSLALNPLRSNTLNSSNGTGHSLNLQTLAGAAARSNSSVGSGTPPSSIRTLVSSPSTKSTGFFASLGRKTSLSGKRDRPHFPPPGSVPIVASLSSSSGSLGPMSPVSARLTKKSLGSNGRSHNDNPNISRPINITNPPSVPGGPRAPPYRAQRSQTFTTTFLPHASSDIDRDQAVGRRPSLFNITSDTVIDIQPDPAFTRQVDQLAAVLPHADRAVLAGYLRRAGQDMLAIGQYLEDERMGTIRQP